MKSNLSRVSIASLISQDDAGTELKFSSVPSKMVSGAKSSVRNGTGERTARSCVRRIWTASEDELLLHLVGKEGPRKWNRLAKYFDGRTGGQLRARWAHTLSGKDSKEPFTPEEDMFILQAQALYGNCWAEIARKMPHRVDNSVKNRFRLLKSHLKRSGKHQLPTYYPLSMSSSTV
mmetsp:Transcript_4465/g.7823  ORF Transcript_4465/g.7823 Transcript_4465/m.7823 type:complete len:176 (-) Transcript_4465:130-657(-)